MLIVDYSPWFKVPAVAAFYDTKNYGEGDTGFCSKFVLFQEYSCFFLVWVIGEKGGDLVQPGVPYIRLKVSRYSTTTENLKPMPPRARKSWHFIGDVIYKYI